MFLDGEAPCEPIDFIEEIVSFIFWFFPWFFLGIAFDHEYQDAWTKTNLPKKDANLYLKGMGKFVDFLGPIKDYGKMHMMEVGEISQK